MFFIEIFIFLSINYDDVSIHSLWILLLETYKHIHTYTHTQIPDKTSCVRKEDFHEKNFHMRVRNNYFLHKRKYTN